MSNHHEMFRPKSGRSFPIASSRLSGIFRLYSLLSVRTHGRNLWYTIPLTSCFPSWLFRKVLFGQLNLNSTSYVYPHISLQFMARLSCSGSSLTSVGNSWNLEKYSNMLISSATYLIVVVIDSGCANTSKTLTIFNLFTHHLQPLHSPLGNISATCLRLSHS